MQIIMRRIPLLSTKETEVYCTTPLTWLRVEAKIHARGRLLRYISPPTSDRAERVTRLQSSEKRRRGKVIALLITWADAIH